MFPLTILSPDLDVDAGGDRKNFEFVDRIQVSDREDRERGYGFSFQIARATCDRREESGEPYRSPALLGAESAPRHERLFASLFRQCPEPIGQAFADRML